MQTISVVTKRCGCYWACSVESGSPHIAVLLAKGRSRRLGVQQRALPQLALGCLGSARDLHRGAGRERAAGHGASLFFFPFALFVWKYCSTVLLQFVCVEADALNAKPRRARRRQTLPKYIRPKRSSTASWVQKNKKQETSTCRHNAIDVRLMCETAPNTLLTFLLHKHNI